MTLNINIDKYIEALENKLLEYRYLKELKIKFLIEEKVNSFFNRFFYKMQYFKGEILLTIDPYSFLIYL